MLSCSASDPPQVVGVFRPVKLSITFTFLPRLTLVALEAEGVEDLRRPVVTQADQESRSQENYSLAILKYHSPWI